MNISKILAISLLAPSIALQDQIWKFGQLSYLSARQNQSIIMSLSTIPSFIKLAFTVITLIVDSQPKHVREYLNVPATFKMTDMVGRTFKFCARLHRRLKNLLVTPRFRASLNQEESLYCFICNFFDQYAPGFIQKLNSGTERRFIMRIKDLAQLSAAYPKPQQFRLNKFNQIFSDYNVINFTLKVFDLVFLSEDCTDLCLLFGYGCCRDCVSLDNGKEAYSTAHTDDGNCIEHWRKYHQYLKDLFSQCTDPAVYEMALHARLEYEAQENAGATAVSEEFDLKDFHSLDEVPYMSLFDFIHNLNNGNDMDFETYQ